MSHIKGRCSSDKSHSKGRCSSDMSHSKGRCSSDIARVSHCVNVTGCCGWSVVHLDPTLNCEEAVSRPSYILYSSGCSHYADFTEWLWMIIQVVLASLWCVQADPDPQWEWWVQALQADDNDDTDDTEDNGDEWRLASTHRLSGMCDLPAEGRHLGFSRQRCTHSSCSLLQTQDHAAIEQHTHIHNIHTMAVSWLPERLFAYCDVSDGEVAVYCYVCEGDIIV